MDGRRTLLAAVAAGLLASALCADGAGAQPSCEHGGQGDVAGACRAVLTADARALDAGTRAAVEEALADERRTEATYRSVIAKLGQARPFSNAVRAEARHASFLEERLVSRGLGVPAGAPEAGTPAPLTLKEACASAVAGERANVALYDRLLAAGSLPDDVRTVFEHNRRASLEHHLPAFERCAARSGPTTLPAASDAR